MDLIRIINFAVPSDGNFLVKIIFWLISISSSVALGVILFTVILKLITFPFDLFSRISMRKNSLKMEEMRPELERLQKQYANDKTLYSQKMMALYKKNGYSMWGSCLPTIITLVVFIVAINAFTSYSNFQNQKYFYDMSLSYNSVIYEGFEEEEGIITYNKEDGTFTVNTDLIEENVPTTVGMTAKVGEKVNVKLVEDNGKYQVYTDNGYSVFEKDGKGGSQRFYIDSDKLLLSEKYGEGFSEKSAEISGADFIRNVARQNSAETFREENASFLWVKNIFMTDSALTHPIYDNWGDFVKGFRYDKSGGSMDEAGNDYNELIFNLDTEKEESNGYFILIFLTAGISLLMQFVSNKAQKAQMELQTVDGQGAQTQKVMMWMMPILMAIFSFMYTAAFSIYIVVNSAISIGTTVLINYVTEKKYNKTKAEVKGESVYGRVYVKKPEKEEKKPAKKVKNPIPDRDFLSGKADKHPGGRN